MNRTRATSAFLLLILACSVIAACRGKPEEPAPTTPKDKSQPVAAARQQLAAPSLKAPPAPEPKQAPAAPAKEEIKGPRTERRPAGRIDEGATGPVTTSRQPELRAPPPPKLPSTRRAPTARIEGEVSALPAPELPVADEEPAEEPAQVRYEPTLVTAKTNVDVVIDASGSMSAPLGISPESKFELLRNALYEVIYEMRQQQSEFPRNLGIRLFGAESESTAQDCQDTQLLVSMGEPNLDIVREALAGVKPRGQSPIAFALKRAMDDFPSGPAVERVVVLVADGADTCDGDPCAVAEEIDSGPVKTAINVVAFDVSPQDQRKLACIAEKTDGQLFLARNEAELQSSLDQAINSTVPYNLKLSAQAGGSPLPFSIAVYRAGTNQVLRRGESLGTKLLSLPTGTYDILVEYAQSPTAKKPSKILKGVEILETTRVEQNINFDLGRITVTALSNEGKPVPAIFKVSKDGGKSEVATVETEAAPYTFFLPPGVYDIAADLVESGPEAFTVVELGIRVSQAEQPDLTFVFQKGSLALKGLTTLGAPIPFIFQVFKSGSKDLVASGALPSEGGSVLLAPGNYDLLVVGEDPKMTASPRTKIGGVSIRAAETTELTAMFEMGTMELAAFDGKGNPVPAEFVLKDQETKAEIVRATSASGAQIEVGVPPGAYEVTAYSIKSILEPKPSVTESEVVVAANQPTKELIKFVLGTLRLRGRSAKELPIRTQFTVYKSGSDEIAAKAPPATDWMIFDLAPGLYDALATDVADVIGASEVTPMIWIRDIKIEDGKTVSHEAIFTAGKLKIIGRGSNNKIIDCGFRVFQYGSDTALIVGQTTNDWEIFEIEPGKYYIEASYVDESKDVTLKKWVNVNIGENEVVELVLRF